MASVYTDSKNKVFNPLLDGVVDLRDKKKGCLLPKEAMPLPESLLARSILSPPTSLSP